MIVKLDRVMLKLKIVVGLIFSVLSLWILCPELIRGSLRDNPVKQFLAVIVLFWLLFGFNTLPCFSLVPPVFHNLPYHRQYQKSRQRPRAV